MSWKTDSFFRTTTTHKIQRTDYSEGFHTFGLEWTKDYLYTWVDNRLQQVLYVDFKKQDLWQRGHFQDVYENSTLLTNPWFNGGRNAPFDQKFYLILNVAVGSRNGWFSYVLAALLLCFTIADTCYPGTEWVASHGLTEETLQPLTSTAVSPV